jgi:predicted secreted protein
MKSLAVLLSGLCWLSTASGADEKPITVTTGQEFKIALESTPSSGNQWLVAKPLDEKLLKLLGSEYKRGRPGAAGAGNEILNFRALGEGKTQISLKYGHLWENAAPARTTNFVVVITRAGPR